MQWRGLAGIPVLLLVPAVMPAADLPSAAQVIEHYITASGGKEAIAKVQTRHSKGSIEIRTFSMNATLDQYSKAPNRQVTFTEVENYGTVIQCYDGSSGWASDPRTGLRTMAGPELALRRRTADLQSALHLQQMYTKLQVASVAKVNDRDAYLVEATSTEGPSEKLFFDVQSGLLVRTEFEMPAGTKNTLQLEDYKAVDGVMLPFTIRQESTDLSLVVRIQEIQQNIPVDDAKFVRPAK